VAAEHSVVIVFDYDLSGGKCDSAAVVPELPGREERTRGEIGEDVPPLGTRTEMLWLAKRLFLYWRLVVMWSRLYGAVLHSKAPLIEWR
jgi:hypothetical protein